MSESHLPGQINIWGERSWNRLRPAWKSENEIELIRGRLTLDNVAMRGCATGPLPMQLPCKEISTLTAKLSENLLTIDFRLHLCVPCWGGFLAGTMGYRKLFSITRSWAVQLQPPSHQSVQQMPSCQMGGSCNEKSIKIWILLAFRLERRQSGSQVLLYSSCCCIPPILYTEISFG